MRHSTQAPDPDKDSVAPSGALLVLLLSAGMLAVIAQASDPLSPVADAGPDVASPVTWPVLLDGSKSYHPDQLPLEFQWLILESPNGSLAWLEEDQSSQAILNTDRSGSYLVELSVGDGELQTSDQVWVTATNRPPLVDAGPDLAGTVGFAAEIDARGTTDPDGHAPLTIRFSVIEAPPGSVALPLVIARGFALFTPDRVGTYVVRVFAVDPFGGVGADTVQISAGNLAPVAVTGADERVDVDEAALLDGTASVDPDGHPLCWRWDVVARPEGSLAEIEDPSVPATVVTPDRVGD